VPSNLLLLYYTKTTAALVLWLYQGNCTLWQVALSTLLAVLCLQAIDNYAILYSEREHTRILFHW
jgi:hypothetical protein